MPRLRPLERHEVDDEIRAICQEAERASGTSASARTLAHHAPAVKALTAFRKALGKESVLDPTLIELVRLKVAQRNACQY
jgi:alkylhydroperoxidase family enzyme